MKEIYQRKDKLQTALSFNLLLGQYHKQACDMHGYKDDKTYISFYMLCGIGGVCCFPCVDYGSSV